MRVVNEIEAESIISRKQKELRQILSRIDNRDDKKLSLPEVIDDEIEILEVIKQDIRRKGVDSEILFHK